MTESKLGKEIVELIRSYPEVYRGRELQSLIWSETGMWIGLEDIQSALEIELGVV